MACRLAIIALLHAALAAEALTFRPGAVRSRMQMVHAGEGRRAVVTKWASGAALAWGLSGASLAFRPSSAMAAPMIKFEDLYPKLEKLREDIIDENKINNILKTLRNEFTKENVFSIARASQEITYADKDFESTIGNIDRDVTLILDILVEPTSDEKKALRIVAFRQISRRLEAEIHSLEKLVTGRTSSMPSMPPAV